MATRPLPTDEDALLEAARRGDAQAFRILIEHYRGDLHAHAYRMLGSLADADDALQDALLRIWRGLPRFEGRSSLRSWLFAVATNACLRLIERRARQPTPVADPYPDEVAGIQAGLAAPDARYERRESLELAFVAALQHLPPNQRAALILRDVLGFTAPEVAAALDTSVASINSALHRARRTVEQRIPDPTQQQTLRALGDRRVRELVAAYVDAWERGDADAIVALLAADARFTMPPDPLEFAGRDAIAAFLPVGPLVDRWRFVPVRANGQLAFVTYARDRDAYVANAVDVLTLRGDRVAEITAFIDRRDAASVFGLPPRFPVR